MDYPRMIYLGGDTSAEYRIVADQDELAAAAKDGFLPHDHKRNATAKAAAGPELTQAAAETAPAAPPDAVPAPQKNKGGRPKKGA